MAVKLVSVNLEMKKMFFDRPGLLQVIDKQQAKVLSRAGAFIRQSAMSSIRSRKRPSRVTKRGRPGRRSVSEPGKPPISWEKAKPNLKTILFYYDAASKSVVVGPMQFNAKMSRDITGILEHGGTTGIFESRYVDRGMPWKYGKWRGREVEVRKRTVRVKARPFMGPALEANEDKIMDLFEKHGF